MRPERIVGDHQRRRLAGDVGPTPAHRHADVGGLERGRVVDPVAGHRNDRAAGLQGLDDPQLLFRHDPGEDPVTCATRSASCGVLEAHRSSSPTPVTTSPGGR